MTQKRFTYRYTPNDEVYELEIIDLDKDEYYSIDETNETVVMALVDLLNGLHEELQIKDYALQKQSEITENQQRRIKELETQLQKLRKTVNKQYVTWREWE